jgi:outer membrane protein insertion porin family
VTRTSTVLREVQLREGDAASAERIQDSKRRLERLGIFSSVNVDEIPAGPGRENLIVSVRESERNYASIGVGLETRSDVRAQALWSNALRPRGTAEFIRSNIFGVAAQVSLVTQFSLIEKRLVAVWDQPYFFTVPMRTQASAWLETEDRTSFGFDRRGASLNFIKSFGGGPQVLLTLSWARTKLTYLKIIESEVDRRLFPYSTSLLSSSFIWDRRDDSINPERGVFLSGVLEWAYPLFAAESDFQKTFWKLQLFRPLLPRLNFSVTARAGLGRGRMPIPERFFAGGSNSFRGEEFDRLGPKDPESGMPVGGKAIFLLNMELVFPVLPSLRDLSAAFFYDLGNVFAQRDDFSLFSLRGALGGGLRYRTPLGPVRLEVGWNLDDPVRRGRPIVYITIGNVF